jgi:hypothetical protein
MNFRGRFLLGPDRLPRVARWVTASTNSAQHDPQRRPSGGTVLPLGDSTASVDTFPLDDCHGAVLGLEGAALTGDFPSDGRKLCAHLDDELMADFGANFMTTREDELDAMAEIDRAAQDIGDA